MERDIFSLLRSWLKHGTALLVLNFAVSAPAWAMATSPDLLRAVKMVQNIDPKGEISQEELDQLMAWRKILAASQLQSAAEISALKKINFLIRLWWAVLFGQADATRLADLEKDARQIFPNAPLNFSSTKDLEKSLRQSSLLSSLLSSDENGLQHRGLFADATNDRTLGGIFFENSFESSEKPVELNVDEEKIQVASNDEDQAPQDFASESGGPAPVQASAPQSFSPNPSPLVLPTNIPLAENNRTVALSNRDPSQDRHTGHTQPVSAPVPTPSSSPVAQAPRAAAPTRESSAPAVAKTDAPKAIKSDLTAEEYMDFLSDPKKFEAQRATAGPSGTGISHPDGPATAANNTSTTVLPAETKESAAEKEDSCYAEIQKQLSPVNIQKFKDSELKFWRSREIDPAILQCKKSENGQSPDATAFMDSLAKAYLPLIASQSPACLFLGQSKFSQVDVDNYRKVFNPKSASKCWTVLDGQNNPRENFLNLALGRITSELMLRSSGAACATSKEEAVVRSFDNMENLSRNSLGKLGVGAEFFRQMSRECVNTVGSLAHFIARSEAQLRKVAKQCGFRAAAKASGESYENLSYREVFALAQPARQDFKIDPAKEANKLASERAHIAQTFMRTVGLDPPPGADNCFEVNSQYAMLLGMTLHMRGISLGEKNSDRNRLPAVDAGSFGTPKPKHP